MRHLFALALLLSSAIAAGSGYVGPVEKLSLYWSGKVDGSLESTAPEQARYFVGHPVVAGPTKRLVWVRQVYEDGFRLTALAEINCADRARVRFLKSDVVHRDQHVTVINEPLADDVSLKPGPATTALFKVVCPGPARIADLLANPSAEQKRLATCLARTGQSHPEYLAADRTSLQKMLTQDCQPEFSRLLASPACANGDREAIDSIRCITAGAVLAKGALEKIGQ